VKDKERFLILASDRQTILSQRVWGAVLLLLFAGVLFSRQMVDLPLWLDEGWTLSVVKQPNVDLFLEFLEADVHPPLYFALLWGWHGLVGDDLLALRMIAFAASLLSLALTFRLGWEWFGVRGAWTAGVVMATSDLLIALTPEVRHYTFYLLMAVLSSFMYWRYTRQWNRRWMIGYVLAALALMYTMYWGAFILIAQGIHFLIFYPRQWQRLALIVVLVVIGYLPWMPFLVNQLTSDVNTVSGGQGYENALDADRKGVEITLYQLFGLPEAFFVLFSAAGVAGALSMRRFRPTEQTALAGLWLGVPLGFAFLSAAGGYSLLTHRPTVALVPAFVLLIGNLFKQLPAWAANLLLAVLLINNLTTTGSAPPPRGPWFGLADYLEAHVAPGDAVVIETDGNAYAIENHLEIAEVPATQIIRSNQIREGREGDRDKDLSAILQNLDSFWLVEYIRGADLRPELAADGFLETTPTLKREFFLLDTVQVTRFARPVEDEPSWTFGDKLGLLSAEPVAEGDTVQAYLLWTPLVDLDVDYSISVFLLNEAGTVAAQHDGYPLDGASPTSGWLVGGQYFDAHTLQAPPGTYTLGVKVYTWFDGAVLPCGASDCTYIEAGTITLGESPQ
jgi:hypothetical protein